MRYDPYDSDDIIEKLKELANFMDKMRGLILKYEKKHNLVYGASVSRDIFTRISLLVEYLDKKAGVQ